MQRRKQFQPFLFGIAMITLLWSPFLIYAGSFTTTIGAGMAFLDWPLSAGSLNPEGWTQDRDQLAEHSHRLLAKILGLLSIGIALLYYFREGRRRVRLLAIAMPLLILFQGVLGGLRVLLDPLNTGAESPIVAQTFAVLHAIGAQGIFLCLALLALVSSPYWFRRTSPEGPRPALPWLGILTWALLLLTILFGAVTRHAGAGLAIPWFPAAFHDGSLIPPHWNFAIALHFAHRTLGMVAGVLALAFVIRYREPLAATGTARWIRNGFIATLCLQVALGILILETLRGEFVTTIHMLNGALTFSLFSLCLVLQREGSSAISEPVTDNPHRIGTAPQPQ